MSSKLRRIFSLLLTTALVLSVVSIPSGAFGVPPASPNTWAEINANPSAFPGALALEMDEPLYNAIFDVYAHTGSPALDANGDGWISTAEAGAWGVGSGGTGGTIIQLVNQGLAGTIRGIEYFTGIQQLILFNNQFTGSIPESVYDLTNLTMLELYSNDLTGTISENLGNLTNLTLLTINANMLTGPIPESIGNLTALRTFSAQANMLTGPIPENIGYLGELRTLNLSNNWLSGAVPGSFGNLTNLTGVSLADNLLSGAFPDISGITALGHLQIQFNPELVGFEQKPGNVSFISQFGTATNLPFDINRVSVDTRYATTNPQDGSFMLLNNNFESGQAVANLTLNNSSRPIHNIDVTGEGRAHLNIVLYPLTKGLSVANRTLFAAAFNQARPITATDGSGEFIGWVPFNMNITAGRGRADFIVSPDYPHYIVPKPGHEAALAPVAGVDPPNILVPNTTDPFGPNYDANGNGIPDTNIDLRGMNPDIPILNVDITGDGKGDLNTGVGGRENPIQSDNPGGTNYLPPGGNLFPIPGDLINIDVNGDGTPDFNLDTTGDGTADTNIIENGKLSRNIVVSVLASAGGTATGSGKYDAGTNPKITATPDKGYAFVGWEGTTVNWLGDVSAPTVTFANAKAASTTFAMPHAEVMITAQFVLKPTTGSLTRPPVEGDTSVSGKGTPGDTIIVEIDGKEVGRTVVDENGDWSLEVPALKPGQTVTITPVSPDGVKGDPVSYVVEAKDTSGGGDDKNENGSGGTLGKFGDSSSVALPTALLIAALGTITLAVAQRRKSVATK